MLSSLRIRNFRVFDAIDIERLARVNLVVGKNNAGKTCLLEALRLYGDSASEECVRRVLRGRDEDRPGQLEETATEAGAEDSPQSDPISRLFHGYQLPSDGTAIEIGPCEGAPAGTTEYSLRLLLAAFVSEINGGDATIERRIQLDDADEDAAIRLLVERKEPGSDWTTLRRRKLYRELRPLIRDEEGLRTRFVGTNALDIQTLEHWRRVAVRPSARAVIEDALRIIDPEIQEIVVLPSSNPRRAMGEVILIYDDTKRLSLRSLGDGIQRLFQIMLAMVASPGGLVLIDEFENGLHWSVQGQAWELIFRLSEELGVQVVATSHSWDCVESFRDVMSARGGDEGVLLHIGRSARNSTLGAFVATHYDRKALEQMTRAGLEVR